MSDKCFVRKLKNLTNPLNDKRIDKLKELLERYKINEYIYPGTLIRNINIQMKDAYEILDVLEEQGFVTRVYEVICPHENKGAGHIFNSYSELIHSNSISCNSCDSLIDPTKYNLVIYKVKRTMGVCKDE